MLISSFKDIHYIHLYIIIPISIICPYIFLCTCVTLCACIYYTCVFACVHFMCFCSELCPVLSKITHTVLLNFVQTSVKTLTHRALWVCIRNINAHINFMLTFCHPRAPYCSPNRKRLFLIPWSQCGKHTLAAGRHALMKLSKPEHSLQTQIRRIQS